MVFTFAAPACSGSFLHGAGEACMYATAQEWAKPGSLHFSSVYFVLTQIQRTEVQEEHSKGYKA